ncbi:Vacuolar amino acid transporter 5 [Venturia nashicola]|uniref:Vacuolar amino acid transporter 5 n=1 Tax=Venturia nashicola TaxID=86259 RepID=A0A4Z1PE86_9PEZI|nr:Vacuolar amino acid transporter 5 [Venturia nashicola]
MPESLSEAIGRDHDDFSVCYNEIKRATDDATKIKWRNQLTWNVARHTISEELTWYPAMEKYMGELGKNLAEEDKEQQMNGYTLIAAWLRSILTSTTCEDNQDTSPTSPKFMPLLEELMKNLHHHIEHEKNEDMPRLEKLLSREESQALAQQFQHTKNFVPTRSHPSAPTSSWAFEGIAALLAAPIDKLRDLMMNEYPAEGEVGLRENPRFIVHRVGESRDEQWVKSTHSPLSLNNTNTNTITNTIIRILNTVIIFTVIE